MRKNHIMKILLSVVKQDLNQSFLVRPFPIFMILESWKLLEQIKILLLVLWFSAQQQKENSFEVMLWSAIATNRIKDLRGLYGIFKRKLRS